MIIIIGDDNCDGNSCCNIIFLFLFGVDSLGFLCESAFVCECVFSCVVLCVLFGQISRNLVAAAAAALLLWNAAMAMAMAMATMRSEPRIERASERTNERAKSERIGSQWSSRFCLRGPQSRIFSSVVFYTI